MIQVEITLRHISHCAAIQSAAVSASYLTTDECENGVNKVKIRQKRAAIAKLK